MKKKIKKKLDLNRETLHRLAGGAREAEVGGTSADPCISCLCVSDPESVCLCSGGHEAV